MSAAPQVTPPIDTSHIDRFRRERARMRGAGTGVPVRPREDDGLFGPGSPTWKVWGASTLVPAGYRATVVQMLLPAVAAGVDQFSTYTDDTIGRTRRTGHYFAAVALGDTGTAERTARFVNRMHARVRGHEPISGRPYSAMDLENLLYVHVTSWHSALVMYETYRGRLTAEERARYWRESRIGSELVGVPADHAPGTHGEVRTYFDGIAPRLAVGQHARSILDFFDRPRFPDDLAHRLLPPLWSFVKLVSLPTLPERHRALINIDQSRLAAAAAGPLGRGGLRLAEKPVFRLTTRLLAPEGYAIQRSALRRQREWERQQAA